MNHNKYILYGIDAAILDMDGVITQTALTHQKAWEQAFDEFFENKQMSNQQSMTAEDYQQYVDGKPRYEGVESFLKSRGISLNYGNPEDNPSFDSICGLGNRKNELFQKKIKEEGAEIYTTSVEKIKNWKKKGLKTAVVSSSKNCKLVLKKAGIMDLFDAIVDGKIAKEQNLPGKPNPDIFLYAAKKLNVSTKKSIVFEDAQAGVQAGHKGNFKYSIGVSRHGNKSALFDHGADFVITSFKQIELEHKKGGEKDFKQHIPSIYEDIGNFHDVFMHKQPVFFFDYDGTLTPIVSQPEDAILSDEMHQILEELSKNNFVSIISGRDMDDVKDLVKINQIFYAGSHGFRISGPENIKMELEEAKGYLEELDEIENELIDKLENLFEGAKIDRKRYAIGIHFRNVPDHLLNDLFGKIDELHQKYDGYKKSTGKKIIEIKPDIDWHKGKALRWIMNALQLNDENKYIPVYLGDDVTDEDAFKAIADDGIGILVGEHESPSAANYQLQHVDEVKMLLLSFAKMYNK